jgi:hypothetical protein
VARKRPSIIRRGRKADLSCAVCGKPLDLWSATTALDGSTVCAADCLGVGILRARERPEYRDEPPELDEAAFYSGADEDYGGAVDGLRNVISDADPGL